MDSGFFDRVVKAILNGFNWVRQHIVKPFSRWHQENLLPVKVMVIAAFVLALSAVFIQARLNAPMHSRFASTPIGEPQTLGQNSGESMAITSRKYNPKKHFMVVKMHASNSTSQPLDPSNVSFKVRAIGHKKVPVEKIPLTNNDYVLILSNLEPGYRAVQIKVTDLQTSTNNQTTTDDDDTDSISSSVLSSSNSATGPGSNYYKFIINEDKKFVSNNLQRKSKSQYLIENIQSNIKNLQKQIRQNNADIDAGIRQGKADQNAMNDLNDQAKYSADETDTKQKMEDYQNDFQQQQDQISSLNKKNENKQKQIDLYQKQIRDIRNGKYDFGDD